MGLSSLNRLRTWDVDLEQWAAGLIGEPFVWGTTDCASLVIKGQALIYGVDVFDMPKYKSKAKALRTLVNIKSLRSALEGHASQVGRRFLQAGDIVLVGKGCTELETDGLLLVIRDYALLTSPATGVLAVLLDAIPIKSTTYWRVDVG